MRLSEQDPIHTLCLLNLYHSGYTSVMLKHEQDQRQRKMTLLSNRA